MGKWYKDSKNQYYNEIGLELFSDAQLAKSIKIDFNPSIDHWWIKDYGIDKVWRHTKGAGVKIAVIDSGLDYNHTNIKNKNNISYYNLLNGSTDKSDCLDETTHGTMCAGMIGAHGPELFGVAPEADLLIIKATKDGDLEFENLLEAIEKAVQLKANIISISFDNVTYYLNLRLTYIRGFEILSCDVSFFYFVKVIQMNWKELICGK